MQQLSKHDCMKVQHKILQFAQSRGFELEKATKAFAELWYQKVLSEDDSVCLCEV